MTPFVPLNRRSLILGASSSAALLGLPGRIARAATPTKVGVILPTSGVLAAAGRPSMQGIQFAAKVIKERNGPDLDFVFADSESKPENGRVAAEKLIRDGCTVLIGAWDTGATISAAQAAEAAKVPLVINIASSPQITEQGFTQIFRNFPTGPTIVGAGLARMKEIFANASTPPKSAVVLYVNDTFGQSILAGLNALWDKSAMPMKMVEQIGYDLRAKDLSVEVARAKATGADIVMPITRVNDAIMIVREMVKQDFSPSAVMCPGSPGPYEKAFTDATGKYGNEIMVSVPWSNAKNPRAAALIDRFEQDYAGQRFELNVGFSFEAAEIVADAVARAGSSDPQAIHAALKTTDIADHVMIGGPIRFDAKGQNMNIGIAMIQNAAGKPIVVGPADIAVGKPAYPMTPFDKR